MNREQMEKAVQTLIEKVLRLENRVEKLEGTLGAAVRVTPEEAQKLLQAAASEAGSGAAVPEEPAGSDSDAGKQPNVAEGA